MAKQDLGSLVRQFRILSGSILFLYAITHLLNHSINIISISAADYVRENFYHILWKNPVGTVLLYGSFVAHIPLGFYSIATKKSFKISAREWFQIILPILALLILLQHIAGGFIATRVFEADLSYAALFSILLVDPSEVALSTVFFTLLILFIWTHGVIGINQVLRYNMKSYERNRRLLFTGFYAVPVLAIFGFWAGLKEQSFVAYAKSLQGEENFLFSVLLKTVPEEAFPYLAQIEPLVMSYYPLVVLALIFVAAASVIRSKFFGRVKISYPDGKVISIARGTSILEASRLARIPHQSVCGGKGRCTTCRVNIASFEGSLPEPNAIEATAIERAGLDDGVRLACQLKPTMNLTVTPLVNPENSLVNASSRQSLSGKEQETVVLFIDLREFTKLSEKKLPYDVVYILNKYYSVCGKIIEDQGGRLDKFIGDGIMAIFDTSSNINENCRNAVRSGMQISKDMKVLNNEMKADFSEEIRFGMGIHSGDAIVGLMGYGKTFTETVVGDNVNVASRLEELTKSYKAELVISKYVAEKASINSKEFKSDTVKIRGRKEDLDILAIADASLISV